MRPDLRHHGDRDLAPGLVDLAVNVRLARPPQWLRQRLVDSLDRVAAYPDQTAGRLVVATRHHRRVSEVLVTAGAAEAFTLLARALPAPCHAVVVHPQFTEPEVALTGAGHRVHRVLLDRSEGFRFTADAVPADAGLVVIGNPTNPTSILHPAAEVRRLARPGRVLVVDEAFMDAVPGEPESLVGTDLPGLLVVRSLTKTWGLAGLRAGYVVGDEALVARLAAVQPPWSVSTPALAAVRACLAPEAVAEAARLAGESGRWRDTLLAGLEPLSVDVVRPALAPFVLLRFPDGERVRQELRRAGYAVRRGDTFPGLGPQWIRVAVREPAVTGRFLDALATILDRGRKADLPPARPATTGAAEPAGSPGGPSRPAGSRWSAPGPVTPGWSRSAAASVWPRPRWSSPTGWYRNPCWTVWRPA